MIEKREIAEEVSNLMLDIGAKLDASVLRVKENCSSTEYEVYRKAIGKIMGDVLLDVMNPLYKRHPELKPEELR